MDRFHFLLLPHSMSRCQLLFHSHRFAFGN
jgi:hypothetical protein